VALVGAAGREQPFVLQAGDHVGDAAVAVRTDAAGIEGLITRGQNDRATLTVTTAPVSVKLMARWGRIFAGRHLPLAVYRQCSRQWHT